MNPSIRKSRSGASAPAVPNSCSSHERTTENGTSIRAETGRRPLRRLIFGLLRWSGIPWLLRETAQRLSTTILVYHDPSSETMESHLHALRCRYNVISLAEYVANRSGKIHSPLPRKSLVITLDDGYVGNYDLRGVFKRFEVRPTIFVCTGLIGTSRGFWFRHAPDAETLKRLPDDDRLVLLESSGFNVDAELPNREALSNDEIGGLSSFADIQSHTATHPILPTCTDDRAETEVRGSKLHLEESFGFKVYALAYPNGDYSEREISLARAAGYQCALTVNGGSNTRRADLFRLKRIAIDDRDCVDALIVKASGLWGWTRRFARRPNYGYVPRPLFSTAQARGSEKP